MNNENLKPYKPGEHRAIKNGQKGRVTKSRERERTKAAKRHS